MLANVFQTAKLNFLNDLSGGGSAVRSKATAGAMEGLPLSDLKESGVDWEPIKPEPKPTPAAISGSYLKNKKARKTT